MIIPCDVCNKKLNYKKNEVFHASGIINSEPNGHIHLCLKCYGNFFGELKVLKGLDKNAVGVKEGEMKKNKKLSKTQNIGVLFRLCRKSKSFLILPHGMPYIWGFASILAILLRGKRWG